MAMIKEIGGPVLTPIMISGFVSLIISYGTSSIVLITSIFGIYLMMVALFICRFDRLGENGRSAERKVRTKRENEAVGSILISVMISGFIIWTILYETLLMVLIASMLGIYLIFFAALFILWVDKPGENESSATREARMKRKKEIVGSILTAVVLSGFVSFIIIHAKPLELLFISIFGLYFMIAAILFIRWANKHIEKGNETEREIWIRQKKEMGRIALTSMMISGFLTCIVVYGAPIIALIIAMVGLFSMLFTILFVYWFRKYLRKIERDEMGMGDAVIMSVVILSFLSIITIYGIPIVAFMLCMFSIYIMIMTMFFIHWVGATEDNAAKEKWMKRRQEMIGPLLMSIVILSLLSLIIIFGTPVMAWAFCILGIFSILFTALWVHWSDIYAEKAAREHMAKIMKEAKGEATV